MKVLAWIIAVLLILAGLHAVDWSLAASIAFVGLAMLLMAWVVADPSSDPGTGR